MVIEELANKYTGEVARLYEQKRSNSWKWKFEQDAVQELLKQANAKSVLDVPVGTGRFIAHYQSEGLYATGMDISADMLYQARLKGSIEFIQGDLFALNGDRQWDVVVCVRFLNWLQLDEMETALAALRNAAKKFVVISLSTSKPGSVHGARGTVIPGISFAMGMIERSGFKIVKCISKELKTGAAHNMMLLEK